MCLAAVPTDFKAPDSEEQGSRREVTADRCLLRQLLLASLPLAHPSFGYDVTDEFGTKLFHKEQGDASNAKTGSYGYRDANGIFRTVKYVADANGFRATIDTNEPGTAPGASADAVFNANPVAATAVAAGGRKGAYGPGAAAGGPWAG
ncbi:hypothetical protein HPB52_023824 [Rhipicephalus sanguineus]|uniref:Cuticle protein n=1 Tax=Rhipicephalus sanguineus TaxID=34632 RepID=A0A9D4Q4J7_RHISA|nr:hypothetical protein HPB52_023824 [Rhipicephalus sanguineus]